jgi:predicted  nucleic acid-binding Zn ribbon protein
MLFTEFTFEPKTETNKEELWDAVILLYAALKKNGQVWGDPVMGWVGGGIRLACATPRRDSPDPEHHSGWVDSAFARLTQLCAAPPLGTVLDDRCGEVSGSLKDAQGLYLFTHAYDSTSPVCGGADGEPVPVYLLPLDHVQRQDLVFWMSEYRALDEVWLASGRLELEAYRELADPDSHFSKRGRALANIVEASTGPPMYYYLMRYWARASGEQDRPCPMCGRSWASTIISEEGLNKHEFHCDPCRLISTRGVNTEHPEHAIIGDWNGASASL